MRVSYPRLYASADGETHLQDLPVYMCRVVYVPGFPEVVDVAPAQPVTVALTFSRLGGVKPGLASRATASVRNSCCRAV